MFQLQLRDALLNVFWLTVPFYGLTLVYMVIQHFLTHWNPVGGNFIILYLCLGLIIGANNTQSIVYLALQNGVSRKSLMWSAIATFGITALLSELALIGWHLLARLGGGHPQLFLKLIGYRGSSNLALVVACIVTALLSMFIITLLTYTVSLTRGMCNSQTYTLVVLLVIIIGIGPGMNWMTGLFIHADNPTSVFTRRIVNGSLMHINSAANATPWLMVGMLIAGMILVVAVSALIFKRVEAKTEVLVNAGHIGRVE